MIRCLSDTKSHLKTLQLVYSDTLPGKPLLEVRRKTEFIGNAVARVIDIGFNVCDAPADPVVYFAVAPNSFEIDGGQHSHYRGLC